MIESIIKSIAKETNISRKLGMEATRIYDSFEDHLSTLYRGQLIATSIFTSFIFSLLLLCSLLLAQFAFQYSDASEGLLTSAILMTAISFMINGIYTLMQKAKSRERKRRFHSIVTNTIDSIIDTVYPDPKRDQGKFSTSPEQDQLSNRLEKLETALLLLIEQNEMSIEPKEEASRNHFERNLPNDAEATGKEDTTWAYKKGIAQ